MAMRFMRCPYCKGGEIGGHSIWLGVVYSKTREHQSNTPGFVPAACDRPRFCGARKRPARKNGAGTSAFALRMGQNHTALRRNLVTELGPFLPPVKHEAG